MENRFQKAFTLLEIIFVIVVIGILSAIIAPSVKRATLQEAADQIVSHIRYTQHLALQDNKFSNSDPYWYKGRWQIIFGRSSFTDNQIAYSIFSDKGAYSGSPGISEFAKNPLNPTQFLTGGYSGVIKTSDKRAMKNLNIGKKYGISSVIFSGGCSGAKRLAFDYLGRPLSGNMRSLTKKYSSSAKNFLLQQDCIITISNLSGEQKRIIITPETGYAYVN